MDFIRIVLGTVVVAIGIAGAIVAIAGVIVEIEQPGAYELAILLFVVGSIVLSGSIFAFWKIVARTAVPADASDK